MYSISTAMSLQAANIIDQLSHYQIHMSNTSIVLYTSIYLYTCSVDLHI